jgi:hypothetical protein
MGQDAWNMDEEEPKTYEFITVSKTEEIKISATQTRIKKHVMKKIGFSRRRPEKNPILCDTVINPCLPLGPTAVDPFATYPHQLGESEQGLVAYSELYAKF